MPDTPAEPAAGAQSDLPGVPALAGPGAGARRAELLEVAATVFRRRGFRNASMREIAQEAGILGGSLYHHFASKAALYTEVHALALARAGELIERAVGSCPDPWVRLEVACRTHLEIQLDPASATLPLMNDLPLVEPGMRSALVAHRDRFEAIYRRLVDDLPLPSDLDRGLYRTLLLSTVNAAPTWYRPGRLSVCEIAAGLMRIFRHAREVG